MAMRGNPPAGVRMNGSRRPSVLEIAGPAGAGKSTLVRALLARDRRMQVVQLPHRVQLAPFYARRAAELLPTYLLHYRGTRWFTRQEAKAMALVEAWQRRVEASPSHDDRIWLFDQGPVFRLAVMSGLGPPIVRSRVFTDLLKGWARSWSDRLDLVVWLSAPDDVLLHRIRTRPQNHAVKGWLDDPALRRIGQYGSAIQRVIEELASSSSILVLKFDTGSWSPESIADGVLSALREDRKLRG